ncbi:hypothetical protein [Corynebacterium glyciniphilum]|uniref:hypothetical protein n=1 Tax=Corynebacterium glyciniphilum TaxID=1404244 RepID=UPI0011AB6937|nr:hypothetical protein [Corynebacterium glyciniphilum]
MTTPDPTEDQLERILVDAEDALQALREELAEHRRLRQQHDAVEQLPHLINASSEKWVNARLFFDELLEELRANRQARDMHTPRTGSDAPQPGDTPGAGRGTV